MNKRYQVFVSSTYADLQEERSRVMQTLMEMDCIPSGMELFPAADEEQFEFIKKVIDDCDYYLLIIGGRYGSITSEGVSYTEQEYEYAILKGLKIIALLHKEPDSIPTGKTDKNADLSERLKRFREKVEQGRIVKYWRTAEELPGMVSLSLTKTIKTYPATGWVRGNTTASSEVLEEINELRNKNKELQAALNSAVPKQDHLVDNLAGLNEPFEMYGTYQERYDDQFFKWSTNLTFGEMFSLIGPDLIEHPSDRTVKRKLIYALLSLMGKKPYDTEIEDHPFQTFKIQLQALGLINLQNDTTTIDGNALCWSLTDKGKQIMVELRAVRKKD
jgi:hypothetical protein